MRVNSEATKRASNIKNTPFKGLGVIKTKGSRNSEEI